MGNVLTYKDFLNEAASQGYTDLKNFFDDLLTSFFTADDVFYDEELDKGKDLTTAIAEFTHGILLDVISGNKERVVVYMDRLSNETKKPLIMVKRILDQVLSKHSENIKKSTSGNIYFFTYKKR